MIKNTSNKNKHKKVFIVFVILGIVFATLLILISMRAIFKKDVGIKNLSDLLKNEQLYLMKGGESYGDIKQKYKNEETLEDYNSLKIVGFYNEEKYLRGGGCLFDVTLYRFLYDDRVFPIDYQNLFVVTKPENLGDFLSLVTIYDKYNIEGCGKKSLIDLSENYYEVKDPDGLKCNFSKINIEPEFNKVDSVGYYFFLDEESPLRIYKVTIEFNNPNAVSSKFEEVGKCDFGGVMF